MFSMKKKIVEIKKINEKKFIRFQGEDLKKNQICFTNNEIINFRSLSLAKTIGIKKINVKKNLISM